MSTLTQPQKAYILVKANRPDDLAAAVNEKIKEGFSLVGGPYLVPLHGGEPAQHIQAMVFQS